MVGEDTAGLESSPDVDTLAWPLGRRAREDAGHGEDEVLGPEDAPDLPRRLRRRAGRAGAFGLGHSDPAATLRHYVRLTTAALAKAVAGIDEVTRDLDQALRCRPGNTPARRPETPSLSG